MNSNINDLTKAMIIFLQHVRPDGDLSSFSFNECKQLANIEGRLYARFSENTTQTTLANCDKCSDSVDAVINRLKKLKPYHNGSYGPDIDAAIAAMKFDVPKEVLYESDVDADGCPGLCAARCPNCNWLIDEAEHNWEQPYCMKCGQALKWCIDDEEGSSDD